MFHKILSFPKSDLLVGCYPCQGFNQGGVRDDRKLTTYTVSLIRPLGILNQKHLLWKMFLVWLGQIIIIY